MRVILNGNNGKLIYEHKPPFRACDQSVFIEKNKNKILIFNAENVIPDIYKDTRTYSLRELYMRFIKKIQGDCIDGDLPTFKTGYQVKKIIEKINQIETQ